MDLLYIGQTGFKDMDLCFQKILKPTDKLVHNQTIVTVDDELLIQRLLATGRFQETTKVPEVIEEEDDDDEVIFDDEFEDLEEINDDEED